MSQRNTLLFSSVLLAATVAVMADHQQASCAAPAAAAPVSEQAAGAGKPDESYAPCGAL